MNLGSSSGASWSSAGAEDGAGDQFPAGLRVLVVDDDPTCLMILEKMLRNCNYEVTKCNRAEVALALLRENKSGYDVVISDVHMPDMDGFKLLVHIGLEMDLPVIMMSADDSKNVVMKGITHGACDYLIKPVRMEALRNIWQHVVRKRKQEREDIEPSVSLDEAEKKPPEDLDSANEGQNGKNAKKRKDEEDEDEEKEHSSSKKPRLVWSMELHQQFVAAVNQLGYDKAVPKKILDLMNVPGVTRENVASHLQKYRNYLKKLPHQSSGINPPFMGNLDASYGSLNQLPAISVPLIDQRNIFSFENPNPRYGQIQTRQGHNGNITKHMNLLHGVPTTMEPNQLAGFHHSFTGVNSQGLIPLTGQGQGQSQSHVSRHPVLANGMVGIGNNFPHRGNLGIPPIVSTSTLQRDGNVENAQNRLQNRGFQGVDLTPNSFRDSNNMQGGLNVGGSKVIVSSTEGSWTHITDNSLPVNQPFGIEEYNPEDLLTPFLTQQENEFGFDWCSSENFPV